MKGRVIIGHMAHFMAIDTPADVIRSPLHRISVPVVFGIKMVYILMRLVLFVAIPVNNVHGKWVTLNRRNDLDV